MLGGCFGGKKLLKAKLILVVLGKSIILKEQINAKSPEGLQKRHNPNEPIQENPYCSGPQGGHFSIYFFLSTGIEIFGSLRPVWVIVSEPLERC